VGLGDEWYGESNGLDPVDPYKGFHAPPYQTELWFYSVDNLMEVVQGQMQPWEIRPYERVVVDPYLQGMQRTPGPIAFDAANGRLFLMEPSGTTDQWGSEPMPVIHVFQGSGGGTNHAPVAGEQSLETPQDAPVAITLAASDSDGDPLSYEIVDGPASGTLDLRDDVATYTPAPGWDGEDRFTFRAYDGLAYSNTATVSITVYDPGPVVEMPAGYVSSSVLVRRRDARLQVVDQRGGRVLLDEPARRLNSLTVVGADNRTDMLTVDWPPDSGAILPGGVLFEGGTGRRSDALMLRSAAGADAFAVAAGSAVINGLAVQFSEVERVTLEGGKGDDAYQISGVSTKTTVSDSKGTDLLDFSQAAVGVTIDLGKTGGQAQKIFAPTDDHTLALKGTFENVIGTAYADLIRGNSLANRIEGRGGNDTLCGNSGNDTLYGGDGNDWLYGDAGNDSLYGEPGNNVLLGGAGNDQLDVAVGAGGVLGGRNLLLGGKGRDTLRGGSGEEILIGSSTNYDSKPLALGAIMEEWASETSFLLRQTHLTGGITAPDHPRLGLIQLVRKDRTYPKGTVLDDNAADRLFGGPGDDWFFPFGNEVPNDG